MSAIKTSAKKLPKAMQHTIIYGISIAFMKGISLIMLPFIANHISSEAFGRLELLSSIALIGSVLIGMGLEHTLFRFAGTTHDSVQRKKIASSIFGIALVIGTLSIIVSYLSHDAIAAYLSSGIEGYHILLILAVLSLEGCVTIPLGWMRMNDHVSSFFFATTGRACLHAALTVVFVLSGRGIAGILEAGLIAAIVQAVFLFQHHIRSAGMSFDWLTTKTSLIYSIPIVGSGLVAFALNGFDRWVLADTVSLTDIAQYGVAAKFSLAVVLLLQPFTMWWNPKRFQVLSSTRGAENIARYVAIGTVLLIIITSSICAFAPLMIELWLPASYGNAAGYLLGIALAMFFKEMCELYNIGCFSSNSTRGQLLINITGSVVGIACMFVLAQPFHVWGVIYALIIAHVVRFLLFYMMSQQVIYIHYPLSKLLLLTACCAFTFLLSTKIDNVLHRVIYMNIMVIAQIIIATKLDLIPLHKHKGISSKCA